MLFFFSKHTPEIRRFKKLFNKEKKISDKQRKKNKQTLIHPLTTNKEHQCTRIIEDAQEKNICLAVRDAYLKPVMYMY